MRRTLSNLLYLLALSLSTGWVVIAPSAGVLAAEPGEVFDKMLRFMQQLPRNDKRSPTYAPDSSSEPNAYSDAHGSARYFVGEVRLGQEWSPGSRLARGYECSPSEQFSGYTWCNKKQQVRDAGRLAIISNSLLYSNNGRVAYSNQSQIPTFLNSDDIRLELESRARQFGEKPKILKSPSRLNMSEGLIAIWGQITLEPLDSSARQILSSGESPKKGLLVDFLNDLTLSAREDLPVYRLGGRAGYLLIASYDKQGAGKLRLVAVDVSALTGAGVALATTVDGSDQISKSIERGRSSHASTAEVPIHGSASMQVDQRNDARFDDTRQLKPELERKSAVVEEKTVAKVVEIDRQAAEAEAANQKIQKVVEGIEAANKQATAEAERKIAAIEAESRAAVAEANRRTTEAQAANLRMQKIVEEIEATRKKSATDAEVRISQIESNHRNVKTAADKKIAELDAAFASTINVRYGLLSVGVLLSAALFGVLFYHNRYRRSANSAQFPSMTSELDSAVASSSALRSEPAVMLPQPATEQFATDVATDTNAVGRDNPASIAQLTNAEAAMQNANTFPAKNLLAYVFIGLLGAFIGSGLIFLMSTSRAVGCADKEVQDVILASASTNAFEILSSSPLTTHSIAIGMNLRLRDLLRAQGKEGIAHEPSFKLKLDQIAIDRLDTEISKYECRGRLEIAMTMPSGEILRAEASVSYSVQPDLAGGGRFVTQLSF